MRALTFRTLATTAVLLAGPAFGVGPATADPVPDGQLTVSASSEPIDVGRLAAAMRAGNPKLVRDSRADRYVATGCGNWNTVNDFFPHGLTREACMGVGTYGPSWGYPDPYEAARSMAARNPQTTLFGIHVGDAPEAAMIVVLEPAGAPTPTTQAPPPPTTKPPAPPTTKAPAPPPTAPPVTNPPTTKPPAQTPPQPPPAEDDTGSDTPSEVPQDPATSVPEDTTTSADDDSSASTSSTRLDDTSADDGRSDDGRSDDEELATPISTRPGGEDQGGVPLPLVLGPVAGAAALAAVARQRRVRTARTAAAAAPADELATSEST